MKVQEADIKEINRIINTIRDKGDYFYERFYKQRHALYFKFWEKHFEWNDLLKCKDIQGHILDFGCGSGHSDVLLAANGCKVHGIDNSKTGIAIASYLRDIQCQEIKDNVSFECMNLHSHTRAREERYDSVWSSHVFEHIKDPTDVFIGLRALVKPAAKLLISVPFKDYYKHPTHVHYWYSEKELEDHLSKYITVLTVEARPPVLRALCQF